MKIPLNVTVVFLDFFASFFTFFSLIFLEVYILNVFVFFLFFFAFFFLFFFCYPKEEEEEPLCLHKGVPNIGDVAQFWKLPVFGHF